MFASAKSALLSSSSNTSNNPNQLNPGNQPGVFSTSANPSNNLTGNISVQSSLGGGSLLGAPSGLFNGPGNGGLFGNASPPRQGSGGLFGSTSGSTSGGLFGNQPEPSGGLFGNSASQSSGGLFGGPQPSGGLLGGPQTSGGLFGGPQPSGGLLGGPGIIYGGPGTGTGSSGRFTNQPEPSGGLFGNTSSSGGSSLFANPPQQSSGSLFPAPSETGGGLFSNPPPQQSSSGSLFSNPPPQQTSGGLLSGSFSLPPPPMNLFPAPTQSTGGLFSNPPPQQSSSGGLLSNLPLQEPPLGFFANPSPQRPTTLLASNNPIPSHPMMGGPIQPSQTSGSLFPAPQQQPSGGLFGNASPQQPTTLLASNNTISSQPTMGGPIQPSQSSGTIFFGQSGTQTTPSLPPGPQPNSAHGTIDYIGRQHVYTDQSRGFAVASITGAIKNQGLEELRIRDFFLMRGNTLPAEKKTQVENIIANNIRLRDSGFIPPLPNNIPPQNNQPTLQAGGFGFGTTTPAPTSGSLFGSGAAVQPTTTATTGGFGQPSVGFGSTTATPQPAATGTFGQAPTTTGTTAFGQPTFGQPTPLATIQKAEAEKPVTSTFGNPSTIQGSSVFSNVGVTTAPDQKKQQATKKATVTAQPVQKVAAVKPKAQPVQTTPLEKQTVVSNPGSFSYEMNKMLFTSTVVSLMQKHNLSVPENLLENTDFVPQLFQFLRQYEINLPTQNVPQFQLNSVTPVLTQSKPAVEEKKAEVPAARPKKPVESDSSEEEEVKPAPKKTEAPAVKAKKPVESDSSEEEEEIKPTPKKSEIPAERPKKVVEESGSNEVKSVKKKAEDRSGDLFGRGKPAISPKKDAEAPTGGPFINTFAPAGGLFGAKTVGGLFGAPPAGGLFTNTTAIPAGGLFTNTTVVPAGGLFTQKPAAGGLFANKPVSEEEEKKVEATEEKPKEEVRPKEEEDGEYQKVEEAVQSPGLSADGVSIISASQNTSSAETLNTPLPQ